MGLNSLKSKLESIKKEYLKKNPRKVYIFIEEDDLPIRIVTLNYNNMSKKVKCKNDKELEELLDKFINYDRLCFIKVKKPEPGDVAVAIN